MGGTGQATSRVGARASTQLFEAMRRARRVNSRCGRSALGGTRASLPKPTAAG